MKDNVWTKPYYGVTHQMIGRTQYTVMNYEVFALLQVFNWDSGNLSEYTFFVGPFDLEKSTGSPTYFWNCGTIENAIAYAKNFVGGKRYPRRLDMSKYKLQPS